MDGCAICGAVGDTTECETYQGRRVPVCVEGDCSAEFDRQQRDDEREEFEREIQDVNNRFGYS